MSIVELYEGHAVMWYGNRNPAIRLAKPVYIKFFKDWTSHMARDFVIAVCNFTGLYEVGTGETITKVYLEHGDEFLVNGNHRMEAIRLGIAERVPGIVSVQKIEVGSVAELNRLYDSIDNVDTHEKLNEKLAAYYQLVGFEPKSTSYKNGSVGTIVNYVATFLNPKKWNKYGVRDMPKVKLLEGEARSAGKARLLGEEFMCHLREHKWLDDQLARRGAYDSKKVDAVMLAASMIKYRADGFKVTKVHKEWLDSLWNPLVSVASTSKGINSWAQFAMVEKLGKQNNTITDPYVEFFKRDTPADDTVGGLISLYKTLFLLERMEEDGAIAKKGKKFGVMRKVPTKPQIKQWEKENGVLYTTISNEDGRPNRDRIHLANVERKLKGIKPLTDAPKGKYQVNALPRSMNSQNADGVNGDFDYVTDWLDDWKAREKKKGSQVFDYVIKDLNIYGA